MLIRPACTLNQVTHRYCRPLLSSHSLACDLRYLVCPPRMRTPLRHALVAHFHARGFQPCFIDPSPRFVLTLVSEWQFAPFWPSYASLNPILTQALSHFTSTRLRAEALEERCLRPCRLVWPYHAACCLCPQPREYNK